MLFQLPRNVWILTASLALFMSLSVFVIFLGGIIGSELSPVQSLSTLPVTLIVAGTVSSIVPVNALMGKLGRRPVFLGVCVYVLLVLALAVIALQLESFMLFCLSTFLLGLSTATMNQFRFAAIESVGPDLSASAASAVLIGGLASAFLGPELATLGQHLFEVRFVGSFVLIGFCFVLAFVLLWFYQPITASAEEAAKPSRPLTEIAKQKVFIVAMSSAAVGYVVMSYIMTATPMSMHVIDGFSLAQTKMVIQSHVVAMFLPSLFTPWVVRLIGVSKMMLTGVVLYFVCVAVALVDHMLLHYWVSLVLLGVGWNFLFIGGTSLLPRAYHEHEKYRVQSVNDLLIFGMQAIASLSAGWFVFNFGWEVVQLSVIPVLLLQLLILIWWLKTREAKS